MGLQAPAYPDWRLVFFFAFGSAAPRKFRYEIGRVLLS